jgi:hypothetical protein
VAGLSADEAQRRVRASGQVASPSGLGRELTSILSKALAVRREERYASAAAFGDDLRRHLSHFPVEAVGGGAFYHLAKFGRRQPLLCAAIASVIAVSIASGVVGTRLAIDKERQRVTAERQAYVANVAAASAALARDDVAAARGHLERAPTVLRNWEWHHLHSRLDTSEHTHRWPERILRTGAVDASGTRVVVSAWGPFEAGHMTHGLHLADRATGV